MIGKASGCVCISGPSHNNNLRGCKLTISVDVLSSGKAPLPVNAPMSRLNERTRVARRTILITRNGLARRRHRGQLLLQRMVGRTKFRPLPDR